MRKWFVVGAIVAIVASGVAYWKSGGAELTPEELARLPQPEQNLIVYDAFLQNLELYYFDRKSLYSDEWMARFKAFRDKAAAAPSSVALYTDVLFQLCQTFPHSHVAVVPPTAGKSITSPAKPATRPASAKQTDTMDAETRGALWKSGPGFDFVELRRAGGRWFVVGDVIPASPAERAGIEPGWGISRFTQRSDASGVHFEGEFLKFTQEQAFRRDRSLEIETPERMKVTYDLEKLPERAPFASSRLDGGVTYVRFDGFTDSAIVDQVLAAIDSAGPEGLIVDLRRNRGGPVPEMARFAGRLLGPDAYLGADRKRIGVVNNHTDSDARGYEGPVVVLVGPSTSSAAEVLAAAVQDNERGLLIGRETNGSVLTSYTLALPDGGAVQVPAMEFIRAKERSIEGVGVTPDILLMPTLEDVRAGRDPLIERALVEIGKRGQT
jgi:C-terminal processing protease CtpA/Prc